MPCDTIGVTNIPYDSNGNYNLPPGYLAVTGQTILASQHNPPLEDIASALSQVLLRSGISPMLGNLNMNGFRITNLPNGSSPQDAATYSQLTAILADPWALQPIGAFVAYDAGEGLPWPPRDKDYRYVQLTAGQAGNGGYNQGVLINEAVSGGDPYVNATAVVNLPGSVFHGKTIRLINSERRFIRPGPGGLLEDSQNLSHRHNGNTTVAGGHSHALNAGWLTGGDNFADRLTRGGPERTSHDGDHSHFFETSFEGGAEARPRNLGVIYYRRIK